MTKKMFERKLLSGFRDLAAVMLSFGLVFAGCDIDGGGGDPAGVEQEEITRVNFNNPTNFQIEVYVAGGRVGSPLAVVEATAASTDLEWLPLESSAFYFVYNLAVDGCEAAYSLADPRVVGVRKGETKTVDIPDLTTVLSAEERDEPVTARAYINITNTATAATLFLNENASRLMGTVYPGARPSRLIEQDESGSFEIKLTRLVTTTEVSRYEVSKDTGGAIRFPAEINGAPFTVIEGGRVYSFAYAGGEELRAVRARAITINEALTDAGSSPGEGVKIPETTRTGSVPTPGNIAVTSSTGGAAVITWTAVSGASKYYVYRITGESDAYSKIDFTTTASYTDTGLFGHTVYYYQVSAYKSGEGESYLSDKFRLETEANLAAPKNLKAVGNSTSRVDLAWDEVAGAQGYGVFRAENKPDGEYAQLVYTEENTYRDSGLREGTTYWYRISAQDGGGQSERSQATSVAILSVSDAAPKNVDAEALSSSSIRLTWDEVPDAERYYVYKQINGMFSLVGKTVAPSWTNTGLDPGTIYYYRVSAFSGSKESEKSTVVSATTNNQEDE